MLYHPDLAAALAQARAAALHDAAAARVREVPRDDDDTSRVQALPSTSSIPLDAYPRLCGLPVTFERLAGADQPAQASVPALSAPNLTTRRTRQLRGRFTRAHRPMVRSAGRKETPDR